MNSKQDIESLLQKISDLYDATTNVKEQELYSKIALLELCGWLEITLDEIVKNYALSTTAPKLSNSNNIDYLEGVIKNTYGFKYAKNFRPILIHTIGIIGVEKLENQCVVELQSLKSELGTIETARGVAAHTTIAGVTQTYESPSVIKAKLGKLYSALEKIEQKLGQI